MEMYYLAKDEREKKNFLKAFQELMQNYQIKITGKLHIQKYDSENNFQIFPLGKTSKIEEIAKISKDSDAEIIKNVVGEYCIIQINKNKYLIKYLNPEFEKEE